MVELAGECDDLPRYVTSLILPFVFLVSWSSSLANLAIIRNPFHTIEQG